MENQHESFLIKGLMWFIFSGFSLPYDSKVIIISFWLFVLD